MHHLDVTEDDIAQQLEEVHLFHIGQDPTKSSPPITVTLQIDSVPVPLEVVTGAEVTVRSQAKVTQPFPHTASCETYYHPKSQLKRPSKT